MTMMMMMIVMIVMMKDDDMMYDDDDNLGDTIQDIQRTRTNNSTSHY